MLKFKYIITLVLLVSAGCVFDSDTKEKPAATPAKNTANKAEATFTPAEAEPAVGAGQAVPDKTEATAACHAVDTGDNVVLKSQTFAIDFEPYKNSCFVTAHNPEFDDPPMESEMAIYREGRKFYDLPGQFNGATFGCWVDAVSFQDLNDDKLTDVVVIGKCSAKNEAYNENMVYVNNGKTLTTNQDANMNIADLKKIKDVADYVKENREMFFR